MWQATSCLEPTRRRLALIAALLLAACGEGEECPSSMRLFGIAVGWAQLMPEVPGEILVTSGYAGVQCNEVTPTGKLGPRTCRVVGDEDPFSPARMEAKLAALPASDGLSIVTARHLVQVHRDRSFTEAVPIRPPEDVDPASFMVEAAFPTEDSVLVVWSEPAANPGARMARLGRLEGTRVEALGDPLFTGPENASGSLGIQGGRDPVSGHVWLDSADGVHVLDVAEDGTLLQMVPHGTPVGPSVPSLVDWTPLDRTRWVGRHGSWLCDFAPLDRTDEHCARIVPVGAPDGYGVILDIGKRADGGLWTVWHVSPDDETMKTGIFLGAWDGDDTATGSFTELRVDECDFPVAMRAGSEGGG